MAQSRPAANVRNRAIAEWRGYSEPRPLDAHTHAIAALLAPAMDRLGLGEAVREAEVVQAWREIVGDFFAAHSAPARLRDGVLQVRVLQSSVHFEMERMRRPITTKLKARFGARAIREVRFRLG